MINNKDVPPIFVINLRNHAQRREYMQRQLDQLPVRYEFIDAVNGYDLSRRDLAKVYNPDRVRAHAGRELAEGEIGCYLSHIRVMEHICERNLPEAIILEDDVLISKDIVPFFQLRDKFPQNWQIMQIGISSSQMSKIWFKGVTKLYGDYTVGAPFPFSYGTQGYVIKQKLCEHLVKHAYPITIPIDVCLFNVFFSSCYFYGLQRKQLVTHQYQLFDSVIADDAWVHLGKQRTAQGEIKVTRFMQTRKIRWYFLKKLKQKILQWTIACCRIPANPYAKDIYVPRLGNSMPVGESDPDRVTLRKLWFILISLIRSTAKRRQPKQSNQSAG